MRVLGVRRVRQERVFVCVGWRLWAEMRSSAVGEGVGGLERC
jgi:hypothetical protein